MCARGVHYVYTSRLDDELIRRSVRRLRILELFFVLLFLVLVIVPMAAILTANSANISTDGGVV